MNYELKLSWRYLRARRKSLARFTGAVAVAGIAAGVAALIVAQALARGFADEMSEKILANTAHITVFRADGAEIHNWENLKAILEKAENVRSVEATVYESALIVGNKTTSYAVLRVIENEKTQNRAPAKEENFANEPQITNDYQIIEISIGRELAEKTGLKIGDRAEIILPDQSNAPRTARAGVAEIFRTGLFDYDSTWIRLAPGDFASLAGKKNFAPTVLQVSVEDVYAADRTAAEIRRNLDENFKVLDWQQANQPLFAALALERKVSFLIISLVVFIAVLNVTTTLALLVGERRLDIAVLRACGAQTRSLLLIFLLEGLFLGIIGTLGGIALGIALCSAANYFHLVSLPAEIYSLSTLTLRPQFFDLLLIVSVALVLSLAGSAYPALRAARVKPLENLRRQ